MTDQENSKDEVAFVEYLLREYGKDQEDVQSVLSQKPKILEALEYLGLHNMSPPGPQEYSDSAPTKHGSMSSQIGELRADLPEATLLEMIEQISKRAPQQSRFELRGELARGGMGIVLRAQDSDLDRELAMKVMSLGPHRQGEKLQPPVLRNLRRFLNEARITAALDHPGIVPVHELGVNPEVGLYYTMRLVRGQSFNEILSNVWEDGRDWNLTRALGVLLRVCEAMAFAHSKGVIHRDLKPSNIMIGRFGEAYVMDWGLARAIGSDSAANESTGRWNDTVETERAPDEDSDSRFASPTDTLEGEVLGTLPYMAPEQARGDRSRVGPHSDVYSIGAILYHLLSQTPCFVSDGHSISRDELLNKVRTERPTPIQRQNEGAPSELVSICQKALSPRIEDRYQGMLPLARDLQAYLEGKVVAAHQVGLYATIKKWVQRNKPIAISMAVAATSILVGLSATIFVLTSKNRELAISRAAAIENEALASERLTSFVVRDDLNRLRLLPARASGMWPPYPENVEAMEEWMDEAEELMSRRSEHEDHLQAIRTRAVEVTDTGWVFSSKGDRRNHEVLAELVGSLDSLKEPNPLLLGGEELSIARSDAASDKGPSAAAHEQYRGLLDAIDQRLDVALTIWDESVSDWTDEWDFAISSIRDPVDCPMYDGLEIQPQVGLVPIGRDPNSGLWEFAHLMSGSSVPSRSTTGQLQLTDDSCMVLVLLPWGTTEIGTNPTLSRVRAVIGDLPPNEIPNQPATLEPYFLSKFEMTQAQWEWVAGQQPSLRSDSGLHPVEYASWEDCSRLLRTIGLVLPTEAQWERAARGGSPDLWWCGNDPTCLWENAANIYDSVAFHEKVHSGEGIETPPDFDDGHAFHAPVGRYRPNPYGFHDVYGNVWEWCQDTFGNYMENPLLREGSGERIVAANNMRPFRGGGYSTSPLYARSAFRALGASTRRDPEVGVRPARTLDN